jgi:hypothetical protein
MMAVPMCLDIRFFEAGEGKTLIVSDKLVVWYPKQRNSGAANFDCINDLVGNASSNRAGV